MINQPGQNRRCWACTALVLLGLWTVVLVLFRGSEDYGMNYDEVLRLAPHVRLVYPDAAKVDQAIYRLKIGEVSIPVMFKSYISSICTLPTVPALFFKQQPAGLRRIELLYFLISVSALFFFVQGYDFTLAAWASFLAATGPHLYPEVRFGFASILHVVFLGVAAVGVRRGLQQPTRTLPWFVAGLAIGLCVNVQFYSLWTLAGVGSALCIVFPRETWNAIRRVSRAGAFAAGAAVGGVNYVVFNVATAGGSLRPLLVGLFDRAEYNRDPIDYRALPQWSVEVSTKLRELSQIVGDGGRAAIVAVAAVLVVAFLIFVGSVLSLRRTGKWELRHRAYCLAPVAFTMIFLAILVTPKSGRAGHWAFVSPFLELAIVSVVLLAVREVLPSGSSALRRWILGGALAGVAMLFFGISNQAVVHCNATKGSKLFSATIYEIHEELSKRDPQSFQAVTVDWGFWSQLYFLSKGRLPMTELSFRLVNRDYPAARDELGTELARLHESGKEVLFLFHSGDVLRGTGESFRRFVGETGGDLQVQTFTGRTQGDQHFVGRLLNPDEVLNRWRGRGEEIAEPLVVVDYGPRSATMGQSFHVQPNGRSAMWFRVKGARQPEVVLFGGERLRGFWNAEEGLVTVALNVEALAKEGTREIQLCDLFRDICSAPIYFPVLPPDG